MAPCWPPCQRKVHLRGLCRRHYLALLDGNLDQLNRPVRSRGRPELTDEERLESRRRKAQQKCLAPCWPPCDRPAYCRGLCAAHYFRLRRGARIDTGVNASPEELYRKGYQDAVAERRRMEAGRMDPCMPLLSVPGGCGLAEGVPRPIVFVDEVSGEPGAESVGLPALPSGGMDEVP